MAWSVFYYETAKGDKPIEDFLNALSNEARAKCLAYISRLEIDGTRLPASIAAHVRGKIWELRPEWSGNEYRFFLRSDRWPAICDPSRHSKEKAETSRKGYRHCGATIRGHQGKDT